MKRHYIFDLDDTLTDSYKFNQQIFVEAFSPYIDIESKINQNYLRKLHLKSKGRSMYYQFSKAVKHFSLNINPEKLVTENEILQLKKVNSLGIFDSVKPFVKKLKETNKELSVISNRDKLSLNKILDNHNLGSFFTNIVSCVEEGHEKPDPHCLLKIIKESKLPKNEFVYFGDSETDKVFADNAGIDFMIVDHNLNQQRFYTTLIDMIS